MSRPPDLRGRRILVTGASGFVGSAVVGELMAAGAEVLAAVDGPARADGSVDLGWRAQLRDAVATGHVRALTWDQLILLLSLSVSGAGGPVSRVGCHWTPPGLSEFGEGVEGVVHLRYRPPPRHVDAMARQAHEYADNTASVELLNRLVEAGHPVEAVCAASSVLVYGADRTTAAREDAELTPANSYAQHKILMEEQLTGFAAHRGVRVAVLRYATVYGPQETVGRAIPNFIRAGLRGEAAPVRGADDVRDYVHVRDVATATVAALAGRFAAGRQAAPPVPVRVYNIGSGVGRTTRAVAAAVDGLLHGEGRDTDGGVAPAPVDVTRAAGELSWRAATSFDHGLREEIAWFRAHPHLWDPAAG